MKVLHLTSYPNRLKDRPHGMWPVISLMPCTTIRCTSLKAVQEHAPTADVIILPWGTIRCKFWSSLTFLNDLPVFIGRFHADTWHPHEVDPGNVRIDVHFVAFWEASKKAFPQWADDDMFWVQGCLGVPDTSVERDIDVLIWGLQDVYYPFRTFAWQAVRSSVVGKPRQFDNLLTFYDISLNGQKYMYAYLVSRRRKTPYVGTGLHKLISRAKICPTGPAHTSYQGIKCDRPAPGKYFENAACGAVTLTEDFTDKKALGFEHGKNIWVTNEDHFLEDLTYLLEHDSLLQQMSENAKNLMRKRHTREIRAQELYKFLCEKTGKS